MIGYILTTLAILFVGLILLAILSPRIFVRVIFRPFLVFFYRKRVHGLENLPKEKGCLVICNHVSWMDGILIQWILPRNVRFVVDGGNFQHPIANWVGRAFDTILMLPNPKSIGRALKTAREGLVNGDVIGIFPEGAISRTGQLQAFKPGLKKILKGTDAMIVPMWIDGMWGSIFSFSGGRFFLKWPTKWFRTLNCYIGEPIPPDTPVDAIRSRMQDFDAQATCENKKVYPVLASRIIRVWKGTGRRLQAADSTGVELSGRDTLIRTLALRRMLRREVFADDEKFVGVLLPPSVGGVCVNVALAMDQRVSANLNYTVSSEVLNHCISEVGIKHVLSSKKFMDKMDLDLDAEVLLLDDLREKVTSADKAIALLQSYMPSSWLDRILGLHRVQDDDLLTVIFTSGSTGMPKGVMLTQKNISHNVEAVGRAVKLTRDDNVLGVLPFFHSFGYSVTLWTVMILGTTGVYHFNPLDARQIGKLSEKYKVTVLLGTPTFLRGYVRRVTPEQFAHLDVVVVGAEKMPADLFEAFEKKFGVRPVEGYGATELSPLVSVNIPPSRTSKTTQEYRVEGSVGRPLPGVSARVVSPETGEELPAGEDGMLLITGPNVMAGYANKSELTEKLIKDGWYETGDIAHVDKLGFIHITGRLSRFSKIGGEMVPHGKVEEELAKLLCEGEEDELVRVCVTGVPDEKKGEKLVVLHLPTQKSVEEMRDGLRDVGLANLFVPAADSFFQVDEIPMLGTGKLDLKQAKETAVDLSGGSA